MLKRCRKILRSLEQEKNNLVEQVKVVKNKQKAINDQHLKECLVEKWNEFLSANEEFEDQKKCRDDIEKETLKIQNELDRIFRQKEPSAGKLKNKIDCDLQKHEELLENKLHVVRIICMFAVIRLVEILYLPRSYTLLFCHVILCHQCDFRFFSKGFPSVLVPGINV